MIGISRNFNLSYLAVSIFLFLQGGSLFAKTFIIPEPALQKAVANSLGVSERDLTEAMVKEKLVRLEANNLQIRDLSGLDRAINLEYLVLRNNLIEDLKPIQRLSKLRKLDLHGNRLSDLSTLVPLSGFDLQNQATNLQTSLNDSTLDENNRAQRLLELSEVLELLKGGGWALRELNLSNNRLLGLSGIEHFRYLAHLDVSQNSLIDLQGISKLSNLVNFFAHGNELGRVEEYVDRNRNKKFDLGEPFTDESGNGKRDTDPLVEIQGLLNLVDLHLYDNRIRNIDSIRDLPLLNTLLLSGNDIVQINSLKEFFSLGQLSLANNQVHSLEGLQSLERLKRLNLAENQICDLRPLRTLSSLHSLDLHSNLVIDLQDLSKLASIRSLGLSYNLIYDPSPILSLPSISNISLSNNRIPLDQRQIKEDLNLARNRGVYINVRNQKGRLIAAEDLIRSLIGYPHANQTLAVYLRENGYPSLNAYLNDARIKEESKKKSLNVWNETLKSKSRLTGLPFLGN